MASPIFLVIFSATVYQEVTVLFSFTCWMETVLYSHMFYAVFQFCTYILFESLDGNIATAIYEQKSFKSVCGSVCEKKIRCNPLNIFISN